MHWHPRPGNLGIMTTQVGWLRLMADSDFCASMKRRYEKFVPHEGGG